MAFTDYLTSVNQNGAVDQSPETSGLIGSMDKEMSMDGAKKFLGVGVAIASKVLELLLPIAGTNSEEGQRLQRALRTLTPLAKGVNLSDIKGLFTMLQNVITQPSPAGVGGITPSGIQEGTPQSGLLESLLKGGGGGGAGAPQGSGVLESMLGGGRQPMPPGGAQPPQQ